MLCFGEVLTNLNRPNYFVCLSLPHLIFLNWYYLWDISKKYK